METLAAATAKPTLVTVDGVSQIYAREGGGQVPVLSDVNLALGNNEIVALLGRSGCGKSTLLRIISGLLPPTRGSVTIAGEPVLGPARQVAMVFQTFALFPWLTVLENVEIGLEAQGVPAAASQKRALAAIDLIGLDGYESAYPKELSGGMRQRVGLARALVVHPKLLLMDEPFSALDVLTAETLRTDLIELWNERRMPISSILIVTHNIEEAVLMSDRILIVSSNPGRIAQEVAVDLPQPRSRLDPKFRQLVDDIYARMTAGAPGRPGREGAFPGTGISIVLPRISPNELEGLMEALEADPYRGHADLPALAENLQMEIDDLFPVADTLQFLRFADVAAGDIHLTDAGRRFVLADRDDRKRQFAQHILFHIPLVGHIKHVLDERSSHSAPASRFRNELEDHMSETDAEQTLRAIISFARYGEAFAYDEDGDVFSLENPV